MGWDPKWIDDKFAEAGRQDGRSDHETQHTFESSRTGKRRARSATRRACLSLVSDRSNESPSGRHVHPVKMPAPSLVRCSSGFAAPRVDRAGGVVIGRSAATATQTSIEASTRSTSSSRRYRASRLAPRLEQLFDGAGKRGLLRNMLESVRSAQKSGHFETFLWKDGTLGRRVLQRFASVHSRARRCA